MHIPDNGERYHIIRRTFYAGMFAYILSSLTSSVGALIDGVIIGQCLGVDSMAAFGLVSPVLVFFSLFGAIIASGARSRFTAMIGGGDMEGAGGIFTLSMLMSVGMSVLMMMIVYIFSTPICMLLGATGGAAGLMGEARRYLLGIAAGLPAMNATRVMYAFLPIDNDRKLTVLASITVTVADIVLDLVVAFLLPHGGIFEIGLATSISHFAGLAVVLLHFRRKERLTRFSLRDVRWHETTKMLARGLPNGIARVSFTLRCILLNQMMAGMARAAACIAAYSVQRQADSLLNGFFFGISDTVCMLTGILVSEQNRPTLRRMLKTSFRASGTVTLGIAVLLWLFAPQFAAFFIKNASQETMKYAIRATRCFALGMPLYGLHHIFSEYSDGRGKTRVSLALKFCSEGLLIVLSALMLQPMVGVEAVWAAFPVSQLFLTLLDVLIIIVQNKKLRLKPTNFWKWYMALPADFDVPDEDRIDRTITCKEQAVELYRAARDFCREHGCDARRAYLISLAVEELANNTLETGFRPEKHNTIDMRILKKGDDYILRMRDDCEIFDPVKQLKLYDQNVPMHHMGIRMAIESAREVQYTAILKLNNLVFRV